MLKKAYFLNISVLLSVYFSAISPIWAAAETIIIKDEPDFENFVPYRELYPVISLNRIREVFADIETTINPHGYEDNCLDNAIKCVRWLEDRSEKPRQSTKREKPTKNMACNPYYAELISEKHNIDLSSKVVRIDLQDGSITPLMATFDPVVLKNEGSYKLLSNYLNAVPLKTLSGSSSSSRAGLLFLVYKAKAKLDHMVTFYKLSDGNTTKNYIIDAQVGTIQELEDFIKTQGKDFRNRAYIWYDKSELEVPIACSAALVKLEDHEDHDVVFIEESESERKINALVEGLLSEDDDAYTKTEGLAMSNNIEDQNLVARALFLTVPRSRRAIETVKTWATIKNEINLQKVAASVLVSLVMNKNEQYYWKDFVEHIAHHANPREVKTALLIFTTLIDTEWGQKNIQKLSEHSDPNISLGAAMLLGGAAAKNNLWAQRKIKEFAENFGHKSQSIAGLALTRAIDMKSPWAKETVKEYAASDNPDLRKVAQWALDDMGQTMANSNNQRMPAQVAAPAYNGPYSVQQNPVPVQTTYPIAVYPSYDAHFNINPYVQTAFYPGYQPFFPARR